MTSRKEIDNSIIYSHRVHLGNWYETSLLEEFRLNSFLEKMKTGELLLAKYRMMSKNLNESTVVTQSTGSISFGSRITLLAPYVPATDPPTENKQGLMLGGRISANEIEYHQDLVNGCAIVGLTHKEPTNRNTFVITSADYCKRDGEMLKYNQEFLMTLASSLDKKPLYVRYDPNPIPGLCGLYPLHFSEYAVSNTRWRILPIQRPDITRLEQEGQQVQVNTDLIVNHCSTNKNLGINVGQWALGFHGKVCAPLMKTCLDVYGKELPNNIWQIYIPVAT